MQIRLIKYTKFWNNYVLLFIILGSDLIMYIALYSIILRGFQ